MHDASGNWVGFRGILREGTRGYRRPFERGVVREKLRTGRKNAAYLLRALLSQHFILVYYRYNVDRPRHEFFV